MGPPSFRHFMKINILGIGTKHNLKHQSKIPVS